MNKNTRKILISALLGASIGVSAVAMASCGGSYELTDFIVNTAGVTMTYEVGDTVSLEGLTMTAIYSDDTSETVDMSKVKVFLGEEDITSNLSKITETVGEKTVKIVYTTKYGEKSKELKFTVTEEMVQKPVLVAYSAPSFIAEFEDSINSATNDATATNFESEFFQTEDTMYVVGADNAFRFIPSAYDGEMQVLANVIVNSTVEMLVGDEYVALTKASVEGQNYVYEYKYENVTYVVENAAKNEFDFASDAIGKLFNLSVLPDVAAYETEITELRAAELEFEVVDGYNVYNARELAVMDNSERYEWRSIKAELGLTGVDTNGIILHDSLKVTKEHIPQEFTYTLDASYSIEYELGETLGAPEAFGLDRTFLWDHYKTTGNGKMADGEENFVQLFVHFVEDGGSFDFYGNYNALDLSELPLVASFDAGTSSTLTHVNKADSWYENNFSNAKFLSVRGNRTNMGTDTEETCSFKNLAVSGNAGTDALFVTDNTTGYQDNTLVYLGGIIFLNMDGVVAEVENVRAYKFFIPFFAQYQAGATYLNTKCYDSANCALYAYEKCVIDVQKSYFQRAGGPLIFARQTDYNEQNPTKMATITIDSESVMESYVTGSEAWFVSIGATAVIGQITELDAPLNMVQKSIYKTINGERKMNLVAVLMGDNDSPAAALAAVDVEGSVTYGNCKLDRMKTNSLVGQTVHTIFSKTGGQDPVFNFGDSVYYYGGAQLGILDPMIASPSPNNGAPGFAMAAAQSSHFALNKGGLGIMLGLYDYVIQG